MDVEVLVKNYRQRLLTYTQKVTKWYKWIISNPKVMCYNDLTLTLTFTLDLDLDCDLNLKAGWKATKPDVKMLYLPIDKRTPKYKLIPKVTSYSFISWYTIIAHLMMGNLSF